MQKGRINEENILSYGNRSIVCGSYGYGMGSGQVCRQNSKYGYRSYGIICIWFWFGILFFASDHWILSKERQQNINFDAESVFRVVTNRVGCSNCVGDIKGQDHCADHLCPADAAGIIYGLNRLRMDGEILPCSDAIN